MMMAWAWLVTGGRVQLPVDDRAYIRCLEMALMWMHRLDTGLTGTAEEDAMEGEQLLLIVKFCHVSFSKKRTRRNFDSLTSKTLEFDLLRGS